MRCLQTGSLAGVLAIAVIAAPAHADYIDHFATRSDVGLYKVPSRGTTRVLVIPVFVDDQPYSTGDDASFLTEIEDFFAVDDRSVFDGGFRFTSYWEQASLGRFRPEATVAAPVHFPSCPPLGDNEDCAIPRGAGVADGDIAGAARTLKDAMLFLNETILCASAGPSAERRCTSGGGVDLAAFDTSGTRQGVTDGFVDGVIVISNAQFPGIALPVRDLSSQPLLSFLGPLPSFVYPSPGTDGITVPSIGIAGFERAPARETFVAVHEFGHLLGFCDLYNEAGTTTDLPWTVMGGWFYSTPASLLDPFSRVAIGWANVVEISGPGRFTIPSAARSGVVLKVGQGDEFFLVEHRQRTDDAVDGDLEVDSGVFIERVRLQKRPASAPGSYLATLQNCVNCVAFDPMLMVEEADGAYDLQRGEPRDDAADLFQSGQAIGPSTNLAARSVQNPEFSTNLLSGAATNLRITVVESTANGAVIEVEAPLLADPCFDLDNLCLQDCAVDDDGQGRCGAFETFPEAGPEPAAEPGDGGCTCGTSTNVSSAAPAVLLLALWSRRRRRR
jgi:M6 family metalloprotease-like protein/uncharacterized protein (TIGR03382 family)